MRYLISTLLIFMLACSEQQSFVSEEEIAISNSTFQGKILLEPLSAINGFRLSLYDNNRFTDRTIFKYKPYRLDTADIDRDGQTDILVGLIKPTEFDPIEKKRLFILRIDDGQLRPLWLGTRVCQELHDFKTLSNGVIQTIEKTKNGNYAVGNYRWQSFGLTLINYEQNEISFEDATNFFHR